MIKFVTGNIFESDAQALVNTVNTVGVMGKGIALQFKKAYPNNFKAYKKACENEEIKIGKLFIFKDFNLSSGEKLIINFPTKKHWKNPSEYHFIEEGLNDLKRILQENSIQSIAIPPLGAGNGGLDWARVKQLIVSELNDCGSEIIIYEPTNQIKENLKKERVKLTKARALLLYMLFDLVKNGEYVSEFSSEKVCYFLQRFGGQKFFNLEFEPKFYGPYSGKVRFVLNALNGSYVMGYSDMNKKPFDPLTLVGDGYQKVKDFVESDEELKKIAENTSSFLSGYYSDFALELLSTVDYISWKNNTIDKNVIETKLSEWSNRKQSMFSDSKYIDISIRHLNNNLFSSAS